MKFNSTTTFFYDNKNNDFQCVECDDEMKSFLDAKGVKYKQVEIQYRPFKNGRIVYSDSPRRTVLYNGYHTGILYKEIIYLSRPLKVVNWLMTCSELEVKWQLDCNNSVQGGCVMIKTMTLLNSIKQIPEIYIGQKSLSRLISFIRGYEYSFKSSIFEGFYEFVCKYYKFYGNITKDFEKVISLYSGFNEVLAFDNFYRMFEIWEHKSLNQLIEINEDDNIENIRQS